MTLNSLPAGPGEQSLASKGNSIPVKDSAMRKFWGAEAVREKSSVAAA